MVAKRLFIKADENFIFMNSQDEKVKNITYVQQYLQYHLHSPSLYTTTPYNTFPSFSFIHVILIYHISFIHYLLHLIITAPLLLKRQPCINNYSIIIITSKTFLYPIWMAFRSTLHTLPNFLFQHIKPCYHTQISTFSYSRDQETVYIKILEGKRPFARKNKKKKEQKKKEPKKKLRRQSADTQKQVVFYNNINF